MSPWKTVGRDARHWNSTCFNEATAMSPWKTPASTSSLDRSQGFNEATAMSPWKTRSRGQPRFVRSLQ